MFRSNLPTLRSKPPTQEVEFAHTVEVAHMRGRICPLAGLNLPTWSNVPTFKVECAHIVRAVVFNSFLDCLNVGGIE